MRRRPHIGLLRCALATLAVAVLAHAPTPARADEPLPLEYKVKAAFLHRFLKFVAWPPDVLPADRETIVVGVAGDTPMARALAAIKDLTAQGRTVIVRPVAVPADLDSCHAVFLPADSGFAADAPCDADRLLAALAGRPVLSVGDSVDFLQRGGVVRFLIANDRIRFEIDAAAAQADGLQISSNLLRLSYRPGE